MVHEAPPWAPRSFASARNFLTKLLPSPGRSTPSLFVGWILPHELLNTLAALLVMSDTCPLRAKRLCNQGHPSVPPNFLDHSPS